MQVANFEKYDLQRYKSEIVAVSRSCIFGAAVNYHSNSYFGGMPTVDRDFVWPMKNGHPLSFVSQLKCSEIDLVPTDVGYLLFFYDNQHWGYSPQDIGHAVVLHQKGEIAYEESALPEHQVSTFYGLVKRSVKPTIYARTYVKFFPGESFPSWERKAVSFGDEAAEECYIEFCCDNQREIQLGGYPHPIQTDDMERECVKAFDYGQPDDWQLLLQLFEIGDMIWGDAGALYWFIHQDDLKTGRFDRVWMVTQCH